nr:hypothetical protein [Tanacetum cinerariifolium]
MAKRVESEKAKIVNKPKEQHVSPIKSGRGKGFMCYGDQVANVPNKLKKDVVPRKIRSLTIAEEAVIGELANFISIQEPHFQRCRSIQLTIDSQTDESVADMYNEYGQKLKDESEESAKENDDADESNMDLPDVNPHGDDDDDARILLIIVRGRTRRNVKSMSANLLLDHQDINKDENYILGPLIVAIEKKFKELIQKDELSIADLEGARLERVKVQYNNDVELEYHHYVARYYKEGIEDRIPKRWSKVVRRYHFKALNGIHHWEEDRIDFFKAGMSAITKGNVYSDLRIKSVVRIIVKKK